MTDHVTIREAAHQDLDAVVALWEELMAIHHGLDSRFRIRAGDGPKLYRDWVGETLAGDDRVLLVAEIDGTVVGFIHGYLKPSPPPMTPKLGGAVSDLVVADSHRRRRVGTRLVEAASDWFREKGAVEVTLNAAVRNQGASEFWHATGFEPWTQTMWKPLA
jgi:ribosomal protein S18 acetylase RimI-like enzyme